MPSLLILSNKLFQADFRKYLMRAAECAGARAMHIQFWEQVVISREAGEHSVLPNDVDGHTVLRAVRDILGNGPMIVLTGLGCYEHPVATILQRLLEGAVFAYDVFDDLMFNAGGFERIDRMLQDAIWRCRCEHVIVLDASLRNRYPRAYHLDNASHLRPIASVAEADPHRMVYIGSIDVRTDFAWLDVLAAHGGRTAIYGRFQGDAPEERRELEGLMSRRGNVTFHGDYDNDDLSSILSQFRIGLLPYRVDHPMTRRVNPDKLYHYLNAGLEVLAAPIPQAQRLSRYLHLVTTSGPWSDVLAEVSAAPRRGDWPVEKYTWEQRWSELVQAVGC